MIRAAHQRKRTERANRQRRSRKRQPSFRARLLIMVKLPVLGRAKTRLGAQIGAVSATFFYRHATRALLLRLRPEQRWQTILLVTPDSSIGSNVWPFGLTRLAQGPGDLGARMQRPCDRMPPGPLVLIGSDIPQVLPWHIARAFKLLGNHAAVLGPAEDGGFWLVGMRRSPRVLRPFDHVRWSQPDTLSQTLGNLSRQSLALAPILNDVDFAEDYGQVQAWSGRVVHPRIKTQANKLKNVK